MVSSGSSRFSSSWSRPRYGAWTSRGTNIGLTRSSLVSDNLALFWNITISSSPRATARRILIADTLARRTFMANIGFLACASCTSWKTGCYLLNKKSKKHLPILLNPERSYLGGSKRCDLIWWENKIKLPSVQTCLCCLFMTSCCGLACSLRMLMG